MPESPHAMPLRSLFASAGPGGTQVDEVAADRGVVPHPRLVLRAVVENHRAKGIPACLEARPQLMLLGDQCAVVGVLVRAITSRSWWRSATPSLGKDRYRWELTVRGERKSRSAISLLVRPSLARRTIWRCWGVSASRASRSPGAPVTATPDALSSACVRCVHDRAPSRWKVPRASVRTGLASLIRRRRRSHSA